MATKDPSALLNRLLQEPGECEWIEYKHNNADLDRIGNAISGCANAAILCERPQAYIVWGVENKTKRKLGTDVRLAELKRGNVNLHNWLAQTLQPRLMVDLLDFEEGGKRFAILVVEPTYDRPVSFSGTEYIRIGENVKKLKDFPSHEQAVWYATGRRKFEAATALSHQTQSEVLDRLDTSTYYNLRQEQIPASEKEIIRKFVTLGAIIEDMEGSYHITNLGALFFAKDITQFPYIASKALRVIKYAGTDKRVREVEEVGGKKGYAAGFGGMLNYIMQRLPSIESYERGIRRNTPKYSPIAIREFLANALIHQDFTITGVGPVVEIYSDRVEISNAGNCLIDIDRIISERRSRNEKFAAVAREMGLCEERGGGVDKAIWEIEEMALPAPMFFSSEHGMRVVVFGPKSFKDLSKADKVWACYCHSVVRYGTHNYMNNTSLRKRFSLPDNEYQAASTVIAYAKKEARIKAADPDQGPKYARYVPYWG